MKSVTKRRAARIQAFILAVMTAVCCACLSVHADAGTITLTIADKVSGKAASGGEISIYPVAEMNDESEFVLTGDFSSFEEDLEGMDSARKAGSFADFVRANGISAAQAKQVVKGRVSFEVSAGVYLVVQTRACDGFYSVSPFLVSVPMDGSYDVVAYLKAESVPYTPAYPEPETPDEPEEPEEPEKPDIPAADPDDPDEPETPAGPSETGEPEGPSSPSDEKLPQTGQPLLPAALSASAGLILIFFGLVLRKNRSNGE